MVQVGENATHDHLSHLKLLSAYFSIELLGFCEPYFFLDFLQHPLLSCVKVRSFHLLISLAPSSKWSTLWEVDFYRDDYFGVVKQPERCFTHANSRCCSNSPECVLISLAEFLFKVVTCFFKFW